MKAVLILAALLCIIAAPAKATPALPPNIAMAAKPTPVVGASSSRAPTAAELASFHSHYRQRFPNSPPAKPLFSITRENDKSAWVISATVDSAPQAGAGRLCRMTRTDFRYSGQWSAGQPRAYAWMQRPQCTDTARAVELLHPMPDVDVMALLANRLTLLRSARILLGGNTGCASQRSYKFELARMDVGTAGASAEVMPGLVFKSDHGTYATVWARRSGLEYSAWNVSCK